MCFSAPVSFTAAAVLAIVGIATLRLVKSKSQLLLAAIPFLFAIQQAAEGVLWLHLPDRITTPIGQAALYVFLFFAVFFWPVWIPLSAFVAEKIQWRKYTLGVLLLAGITWALYYYIYAAHLDVSAQIVNNHIQFVADFPSNKWYYAALILATCFVSSFPKMWLFGTLTVLSLIATQLYFEPTFGSVWCFFAAIISLVFYKALKDANERG